MRFQYCPDDVLCARWGNRRCGIYGMAATKLSIRGRGSAWLTSQALLAQGQSTDQDEAYSSVGVSSSRNWE